MWLTQTRLHDDLCCYDDFSKFCSIAGQPICSRNRCNRQADSAVIHFKKLSAFICYVGRSVRVLWDEIRDALRARTNNWSHWRRNWRECLLERKRQWKDKYCTTEVAKTTLSGQIKRQLAKAADYFFRGGLRISWSPLVTLKWNDWKFFKIKPLRNLNHFFVYSSLIKWKKVFGAAVVCGLHEIFYSEICEWRPLN